MTEQGRKRGDIERQICCCGSGPWSMVIALLSLLGSCYTIFDRLELVKSSEMYSSHPFFLIGSGVLSLIFSIILIVGIVKKKPVLLTVWLVEQWILLAILIGGFILIIVALPNLLLLGLYSIGLMIEGFFIWVVHVHRRELIEINHFDQTTPIPYFVSGQKEDSRRGQVV